MIIFLSLPLLGSAHNNIDGIKLIEFPVNSSLYDSLSNKSINLLGEIVVLPEGTFDQAETAKIISRLERLPESMLLKVSDAGISVILFDGKLTDNPAASHLKGVIPRGYKTETTWDDVPGMGGSQRVLVKIGSSGTGKGHGSVNLELHELAHSIDRHVYGGIRKDEEFLRIWRQESVNLFPGRPYLLNYPEEYFAEAFAMFYIGGENIRLLKEASPETYAYINSLD
ncbi:toxin [Bacillus sp. T33-2]|nr:toxin [Bacillus sp. T33-2]